MDLDAKKEEEGSPETKKMKMTEQTVGEITNPDPNPNRPKETARLIGRSGFYWFEFGIMPKANDLFGLFESLRKAGLRSRLSLDSWALIAEWNDNVMSNFELFCEDNYSKPIGPTQNDAEDSSYEENEIYCDFAQACIDCKVSFNWLSARVAYDVYSIMMLSVHSFVITCPPPAAIIFITGNPDFSFFLGQLREKGYNVILFSRSEDASLTFLKAGLILYDWGAATRGEGLFPVDG